MVILGAKPAKLKLKGDYDDGSPDTIYFSIEFSSLTRTEGLSQYSEQALRVSDGPRGHDRRGF